MVIDVQVLVQTDLLQSTPETLVRCLPPRSTRRVNSMGEGEWIEYGEAEWMWACGVHPRDGKLRLIEDRATDQRGGAEALMFDREHLEKGVIQRGRFRLAAVRRQTGAEFALKRLREQFEQSPPPLSV